MEENLASQKKSLQEIQEATEKTSNPDPIGTEHALELHAMTRSEKRKIQREEEKAKLKELTFWKKIQYILMYYTWKFIGITAAVVLIVFLGHQIYVITRPVALDIVLINDPTNSVFETEVPALYGSYYEQPKDARYVIDTQFQIDPDAPYTSADMAYYSKMLAILSTESTQIIICDAKVVDYYAIDGYILELQHGLPEDLFSTFRDRMYECDGPVKDADFYAIDISGMRFTEQTGIQIEEPYLCIPTCLGEENRQIAYQFLQMISDMETDGDSSK